jgi:predicted RNA-binding Zn-ribbon protein involved in translation (DUF1610 family)
MGSEKGNHPKDTAGASITFSGVLLKSPRLALRRSADLDDDGDSKQLSSKRRREQPEPRTKFLACPFFKADPFKYMSCLYKNRLTSVAFVRQHLKRSHLQSLHCPICGGIYETQDDLSRHVRANTCKKTGHRLDGISEDQMLELFHPLGRGGYSEADRWYHIWHVLFPDKPDAPSAYVDSDPLVEILGVVENYHQSNRSRLVDYLLSQNVLTSVSGPLDRGHASSIVQDMLRLIFDVRSFDTQPSSKPTPVDLANSPEAAPTEEQRSVTGEYTSVGGPGDEPKPGSITGDKAAAASNAMATSSSPSTILPAPVREGVARSHVFGPVGPQINLPISDSGHFPSTYHYQTTEQHDDGDKASATSMQQRKDFKCSECEFRAPRRYALKKHIQAHHKRSNPCPNCPYSFLTTKDLRRHKESVHHADAKLQTCPVEKCAYKTTRKDNLRRHLHVMHSGHEGLEGIIAALAEKPLGRPRKNVEPDILEKEVGPTAKDVRMADPKRA